MISLSIKVDTSHVLRALREQQRQIPFAIARALTATAKDGQKVATDEIKRVFDRPNPFTLRSIGILPANKSRLAAKVFIRDIQAQYLGVQIAGGYASPSVEPSCVVDEAVAAWLSAGLYDLATRSWRAVAGARVAHTDRRRVPPCHP